VFDNEVCSSGQLEDLYQVNQLFMEHDLGAGSSHSDQGSRTNASGTSYGSYTNCSQMVIGRVMLFRASQFPGNP